MINDCLSITEYIEKRNITELSFKEKFQTSLHLKICKHCRKYLMDSKAIDRLLTKSVPTKLEYNFTLEEKKQLIQRLKI